MKKNLTAVILLALLLVGTITMPVLAGGLRLAAEGIQITGPDAASPGEIIEIRISVPEMYEGMSAFIETDGLEYMYCSSGMCADVCLILLPSMGMNEAVYTYRVVPDAERISVALTLMKVTYEGTEYSCRPESWTCNVISSSKVSSPASPSVSEESLPSISVPKTTDPVLSVRGTRLTAGCFAEISIRAENTSYDVAGELEAENLSVLGSEGACTWGNRIILPPAQEGELNLLCLVTGVCDTDARITVRGQEDRMLVTWSDTIREGEFAEKPVCAVYQTDEGECILQYDLIGAGMTLTPAVLQTSSVFPADWSMAVYSAEATGRKNTDCIANGDELYLRNQTGTVQIRATVFIPGDLCSSGKLDIAQVVSLAQFLAGKEVPDDLLRVGDLNRNERLDINDLIQLASALTRSSAGEDVPELEKDTDIP